VTFPTVTATVMFDEIRVMSQVPIILDQQDLVQHLFPSATTVVQDNDRSIHIELASVLGASRGPKDTQATIQLRSDIESVGVGDLSYGFLRFLHAAHTARCGAVVLDGGAVYSHAPGENAVLVLGAGKSTLAYRAVERGIQVMADDSLVLDVSSDPPRASCLSGGVISSRMGFFTSARPRLMRHARLVAAILIQASFRSTVRVQRASVYDSSSWSWRAVSTRLLNSSCFPNSFERPYTPQLGQSIERTMITAHRILTALPMTHILGDPDGETLPMTLREIKP